MNTRVSSIARCFGALSFFIFVACIGGGAGAASDEEIVVRYDENAFPSNYQEGGIWKGMDVDVINHLLDTAGLEAKRVVMPFARAMNAAKKGDVHILPNLTKNSERSEFLDWLGPVRTSSSALIVKPEHQNLGISTYEELAAAVAKTGLKIAYTTGSSYSASLDQKLLDPSFRKHLFFVPQTSAATRMLKAGRVLGLFYDDVEATIILNFQDQNQVSTLAGLALHNFRVPGSKDGVYFGLSKKMPQSQRDKLQQAFKKMQLNGQLKRLEGKWVGH